MQTLLEEILNVWGELCAFGHEPTAVDLGIWSGPRTHSVQFLAHHCVIETVEVFIASPDEFDEARRFVRRLAG